jgi:hypothetical protein
MTRRTPRALALSILSLLLATGAAAGADEAYVLGLGEAPPENPASVTRNGAVLPRFSDGPRDLFMVPMFKVDRSSIAAETTLIAIRNHTGESHDVQVSYFVDRIFDPGADPDLVQNFSLTPNEIRTFNLRDLPEITGGQGGDDVIRGWLMVEHADGTSDALTADWFRADDAENFAGGDRMVDIDTSYTCTQWDFRYLVGGLFTGGTRLDVFIDTPLGFGTPSFSITFFNEAGTNQGTVTVATNRQVAELDVADLLDLLASSPSPFGGMEITFTGGTNGGLVMGTYRASGRLSVSMDGTCLVN